MLPLGASILAPAVAAAAGAAAPVVIGYNAQGLAVFGVPGAALPTGVTASPPTRSNVPNSSSDASSSNLSANEPGVIGYSADGLPIFGQPGDALPAGATVNPPAQANNNLPTNSRVNLAQTLGDPEVIGYTAEGNPIFGQPGEPLPPGATRQNPNRANPAGNQSSNNEIVIGYTRSGQPIMGRPVDPLPNGAMANPPSNRGANAAPTVIGYSAEGLPVYGQPGDALPLGASILDPTSAGVASTAIPVVIGYTAQGLAVFGTPGTPLPAGATTTLPASSRPQRTPTGNQVEPTLLGFDQSGQPVYGQPGDALPSGAREATATEVQNAAESEIAVIGFEADGTPIFGSPGTEGAYPAVGMTQPVSSGPTRIVGKDANGNPIYESPSGRRYTQAESEAMLREQNELTAHNPSALGATGQYLAGRSAGTPPLPEKDGYYPVLANEDSPDGVYFERIPYGADAATYGDAYGTTDRPIPGRQPSYSYFGRPDAFRRVNNSASGNRPTATNSAALANSPGARAAAKATLRYDLPPGTPQVIAYLPNGTEIFGVPGAPIPPGAIPVGGTVPNTVVQNNPVQQPQAQPQTESTPTHPTPVREEVAQTPVNTSTTTVALPSADDTVIIGSFPDGTPVFGKLGDSLPAGAKPIQRGSSEATTEPVVEDEPTSNEVGYVPGAAFSKGYYVIIGSFEDEINAANLVGVRANQGFSPRYGLNPASGRYYVYLYQNADINKARAERDRVRQLEPFKDAWILTIK